MQAGVRRGGMNRTTPRVRDLSHCLIAYETRRNKFPDPQKPLPVHIGEKLRPYLVTLMGTVGFQALLSRALALANAEVPWLRAVEVKGDGSLHGFDVPGAQANPDEIFEGSVVLLTQLLGLLVVFIGENLTLRLIRDVWPKVSLSDVGLEQETKNEKEK